MVWKIKEAIMEILAFLSTITSLIGIKVLYDLMGAGIHYQHDFNSVMYC